MSSGNRRNPRHPIGMDSENSAVGRHHGVAVGTTGNRSEIADRNKQLCGYGGSGINRIRRTKNKYPDGPIFTGTNSWGTCHSIFYSEWRQSRLPKSVESSLTSRPDISLDIQQHGLTGDN